MATARNTTSDAGAPGPPLIRRAAGCRRPRREGWPSPCGHVHASRHVLGRELSGSSASSGTQERPPRRHAGDGAARLQLELLLVPQVPGTAASGVWPAVVSLPGLVSLRRAAGPATGPLIRPGRDLLPPRGNPSFAPATPALPCLRAAGKTSCLAGLPGCGPGLCPARTPDRREGHRSPRPPPGRPARPVNRTREKP
jgi:hypothetical protein